MKEIYIIRHGQTEYNRLRIVQGSGIDSELNEVGIAQRNAFFEHYGHIEFEAVLTSTLQRTHQTVAPFIEKGLPWEQWKEIDEMHWGTHEGKPGTPEMREEYKKMVSEWTNLNFDYSLPKAESARQLHERITRFTEYLEDRTEKKILICSHGRALKCLINTLKGSPLQDMETISHSNTGLYKVIYNGNGFEFEVENDTSHLINS